MLFADLLSLHLVTFLMFLFLYIYVQKWWQWAILPESLFHSKPPWLLPIHASTALYSPSHRLTNDSPTPYSCISSTTAIYKQLFSVQFQQKNCTFCNQNELKGSKWVLPNPSSCYWHPLIFHSPHTLSASSSPTTQTSISLTQTFHPWNSSSTASWNSFQLLLPLTFQLKLSSLFTSSRPPYLNAHNIMIWPCIDNPSIIYCHFHHFLPKYVYLRKQHLLDHWLLVSTLQGPPTLTRW